MVSHSCHFSLSPPQHTHTSVLRKPGWRIAREQQPRFMVMGQDTHSNPPTTAPGVQTSTTFASTSHTYPHHLQLLPLSSDLQVYYHKKKENFTYKIYIIIYEIYTTLSILFIRVQFKKPSLPPAPQQAYPPLPCHPSCALQPRQRSQGLQGNHLVKPFSFP